MRAAYWGGSTALRCSLIRVIIRTWKSAQRAGFSRYGSIPGNGLGISPTPAYFKPCDCLKLFAATLSWANATLMNFESFPHLYHFTADFFGVIDSRLPP